MGTTATPQGGAVGRRLYCRCVGPAAGSRLHQHGVPLVCAPATTGHGGVPHRSADCARARLVPRRSRPATGQRPGVFNPDRPAADRRRTVLVGRANARRTSGGDSDDGAVGRGSANRKRCDGDGHFDRGAAVRQHERGQEQRVLLRRDLGGTPERARASGRTGRRVAHLVLRLQGQPARHGGHCQGAQGQPRPRRQRSQIRQSRSHHGAADRRSERPSPLVGDLRPRVDRHLRDPGRDRERDRPGAERPPGTREGRGDRDRARRHGEPAGV